MAFLPFSLLALALSAAPGWAGVPASAPELSIYPDAVSLAGPGARQAIAVTEVVDGRASDRTRSARFRASSADVVRVGPDGTVTAVGDGETAVAATVGGKTAVVTVRVTGMREKPSVTFEHDVMPLLSRFGCSQGACHGKARGQNGFQLSIFGFDPTFDYNAITNEARGRRVFPSNPAFSLLLRKGTGAIPHGGGKRLPVADSAYGQLLQWIADGCPRTPPTAPKLDRLTVFPADRALGLNAEQRLVVTAHYADGSRKDVTHLASYQSSESVYAAVDANGRVKSGPLPGEAAVMARFAGKFSICNVWVPMPGRVPPTTPDALPRKNFIDGLVWSKLQRLGLTPSAMAGDAAFHRRAFLDLIGRMPAPDETRAFLADGDAQKREKLIDRLLARPEYADFWANKWADLLRPNPYRVGIKAVYNYDAWIRDSFRQNKPYDQFVRELLTASGSSFRNGAVVLYRDRRDPEEIAPMVSQLFLGVRLDCAKCHHHPFEVWGQDDFYSFAAFFGRIGHKGQGVSPPISGGEEIIFPSATGKAVRHPLTGQSMTPTPLLGAARDIPADRDPRQALAAWVTSPENPYFAKVIVNRVWAELMGRGIVDPVDDMRATNPPSNPELLEALAADFRRGGHDLKTLIRTIATSYVYGLGTTPTERNAHDSRNYSRHYRQRLRAEILLDAMTEVTGVAEKFDAMPPGSRAMEAWTVRAPSDFLDSFGRPDPNQDPPCERTADTTVVQALHLLNAPKLHSKVTADDGRAAKLAGGKKSNAEVVEELYLLAYGRLPTEDERAAAIKRFGTAPADRRAAAEDLMWALVNTPEFVFND